MDKVKRLHEICGLSMLRCKIVLDAHEGDVDAALITLVESGEVGPDQLNVDLVSNEVLGLAQARASMELIKDSGLGAMLEGTAADPAALWHNLKESAGAMGAMMRSNLEIEKRREVRKRNPIKFHQPPMPPLQLTEFTWEGRDVLPSWAGFQSRQGPYASVSSRKRSDGTVQLSVSAPDNGENGLGPTHEQLAAYAHLKQNEPAVTAAVLDAILAHVRKLCEQFHRDEVPQVRRPEDLKKYIGLAIVHVLPIAKDGLAYVGLELGCTWEDEHGCGVLTHAGRIVTAGEADCSFSESDAEEDGGARIEA